MTFPIITMQNKDLEKQVRFFQSSVAQAFAERDSSLMEVLFSLLNKLILCLNTNAARMTLFSCWNLGITYYSVYFSSVRKQKSGKKQCQESLLILRKGMLRNCYYLYICVFVSITVAWTKGPYILY